MPVPEDIDQLMDDVDQKVLREGIQHIQEGRDTLEVWVICLRGRGEEARSIPLMTYYDQGEAMQSYGSFTTTMFRHGLDEGWELLLRKTSLTTP